MLLKWLTVAPRVLILLSLALLLVASGCAAPASGRSVEGTVQPIGLHGSAPEHVHYLDMTDTVEPDSGDPGKQLLTVTVHLHADSATQGILAFLLVGDPSTAPRWPHPAYPNGSPNAAAQQVKLAAGDGDVVAKFPLRLRENGKVVPDGYNLQSGGFYDVDIFAGGLPNATTAAPVAAFQTSKQYALPDFGGPPATATPIATPTPVLTVAPDATRRPTPTFAPTSTPVPTATPLPPPFTVGLLAVQVHPQLAGSVGAVPGVGGATIKAPDGQTFVVAIFVVRRDLATVNDNPLPTQLSAGSDGPFKAENQAINASSGSLAVDLPPYGPISIVYDPRGQGLFERQVAAEVWRVPTADAGDLAAFHFDGQPESAYPRSGVAWRDPGLTHHVKEPITLSDVATVQALSVDEVAPAAGSTTPAGLRASLAVSGDRAVPITLRLRLLLQDRDGLQAQADCPVQTYDKLVAGQPKSLSCTVPLPAGGPNAGFHLGVTGSINGVAIPTQWVDLGR